MARHEIVAGLSIAAKHTDEFHCVACLKGKMTAPDLTPSGPKPRRAAFNINVSDSALDLRLAYMDTDRFVLEVVMDLTSIWFWSLLNRERFSPTLCPA